MQKRRRTAKHENTKEKKRHTCRNSFGVERTPGACDTPGMVHKSVPEIKHDLQGFVRLDMRRNHSRILQGSTYLMCGWRGNCDIQYLIYNGDPDNIDPADISRITNYVVSYSCKGNETEIDEKIGIKHMIEEANEVHGDVRDVRRLVRTRGSTESATCPELTDGPEQTTLRFDKVRRKFLSPHGA